MYGSLSANAPILTGIIRADNILHGSIAANYQLCDHIEISQSYGKNWINPNVLNDILIVRQVYYSNKISDVLLIKWFKKGGVFVIKAKNTNSNKKARKVRPALNPEAREKQMIALAVDLAEQQLIDGTASSQVITHYLKLGTTRETLEKELLEREVELKKARTEALQSSKHIEELYTEAIKAMRKYNGHGDEEDDDEENY